MSHWFKHWVIQDFYDPVWPNIAASICVGMFVISRIKEHLKRHHEKMKELVHNAIREREAKKVSVGEQASGSEEIR